MSASWDAVLAAFAARLAEQRAALVAGEPDRVAPFAPPPAIGPFPARLRRHAEDLLQEAAELQGEMAARLAATTREIHAVRRFLGATAQPATVSYVDGTL